MSDRLQATVGQRSGASPSGGPAYRIETERLVIRCFSPRDGALLDAAIRASVDHLKPWMPWAREEPKTLRERIETLRSFRGKFDLGSDFAYGVFSSDESELIGAAGLHTRQGPGIREIGYWIRVDRVRRGFASESAAALAKIAFEIDRAQRIEIRCDTTNIASAGVPKRLGFALDGVLRGQPTPGGAARDVQVWGMVALDYAASPLKDIVLTAYDAAGNELRSFSTPSHAEGAFVWR